MNWQDMVGKLLFGLLFGIGFFVANWLMGKIIH